MKRRRTAAAVPEHGSATQRPEIQARTLFLALASLLSVAAASVAVYAAPSHATVSGERDTRPCVTRAEYRDVHRGMTKGRVHAIFDTPGQIGEASRHYPACGGAASVLIDYTLTGPPDRVLGKHRIALGTPDPLAH